MKSKKAISPLIATVLLVGFSIVLAGIVTTFVINKTKEFQPEKIIEDDLLCDNVAIDITVPNPGLLVYTIATDDTTKLLKGLNLINKGSFTIHQLTINSPGFSTSESQLNPVILPEEGYDKLRLAVADEEDLISIIPWIKHPEEENTYIKCQMSEIKIIPKQICKDILDRSC